MSRDYRVYLDDILQAAAKIRSYTAGLARADFNRDSKTVDAVARNLSIIGEAVKQLPAEIRERKNHVPWTKIAGLRDILIHAYFAIDLDIVWEIVQTKIEPLEQAVGELLDDEER